MERKRVGRMMRRSLVATGMVLTVVVLAQTIEAPPNVFTADTPSSAGEVTENFVSLEAGVATVRDLVIEVRRDQIALRDRIARMEPFVLDPPPAPAATLSTASGLDLLQADDEEPIVFEAGALVDANAMNTRFGRVETDLDNIDEFSQLLHRDLVSIFDRVAVLEDLQLPGGAETGVPDALTPVDATLPHVFTPQTTMRSVEVNANTETLATAIALNHTNAQGLASALDEVDRRVTALEATVSFLCEDLRPDRPTRVFNIEVIPTSPASLPTGAQVVATFDYVTNAQELGYDSFRVWFRPYFDGSYASGGSFQGSVAVTGPSGTLSRYFSSVALEAGASTVVNEGIISMSGVQFDDGGTQTAEVRILECVVPVDVTFTQPE